MRSYDGFDLVPKNESYVFPSVVERVSKRQQTHRSTCATLVTGVSPTALSQILRYPVAACLQMGCRPGCLGQITSVEENHMAWMNFCQWAVEATTVTPERDPRAPQKPVRPALLTSMAENMHTAVRTSGCRKLLWISFAPNLQVTIQKCTETSQ